MPNVKLYSDEHLNAFIDNQLNTTEKSEILDAIRHDSELSQRVCKLQKLHNLIQLSYESVEVPEHHRSQSIPAKSKRVKWMAAASFFLMLGTLVGWVSHQAMNPTNLSDIIQISHNSNTAIDSENWKLMLHVSTARSNKLNILLNEAEALLKKYANSSQKLELEILANSEGVALVANNGHDYNKRLLRLQQKYNNLAVLVCGETLHRIQHNQGNTLNLLPNTKVVPSAISQIIKRQRGGWSYIKI